jgi:hypothetical protein
MNRAAMIAVRNKSGDELTVIESWHSNRLGFVAEQRFHLPDGQEVVQLADDVFVVLSTNETLTRAHRSNWTPGPWG